MNNSTDEYGCKLQEVFENERLVGSAIPLISDDLDSCFSRKSLLGNDPANWSAANGQECKFDADEDRTSPPVNPMPKVLLLQHLFILLNVLHSLFCRRDMLNYTVGLFQKVGCTRRILYHKQLIRSTNLGARYPFPCHQLTYMLTIVHDA